MPGNYCAPPTEGTRVCKECGAEKVIEDFHLITHKPNHGKRRRVCKTCVRWRDDLKKLYKTTPEIYNALLAKQGGGCALCGLVPNPEKPAGNGAVRLHTDHNHKTKKIRGILCRACNWMLGRFGDDPRVLIIALEKYLPNHDESCIVDE